MPEAGNLRRMLFRIRYIYVVSLMPCCFRPHPDQRIYKLLEIRHDAKILQLILPRRSRGSIADGDNIIKILPRSSFRIANYIPDYILRVRAPVDRVARQLLTSPIYMIRLESPVEVQKPVDRISKD